MDNVKNNFEELKKLLSGALSIIEQTNEGLMTQISEMGERIAELEKRISDLEKRIEKPDIQEVDMGEVGYGGVLKDEFEEESDNEFEQEQEDVTENGFEEEVVGEEYGEEYKEEYSKVIEERQIINEVAKPDWYDWEVDYPAAYIDDVYKGISFNDRYEFIKELFNVTDNLEEAEMIFKKTLDAINEMDNFKMVVAYIREEFPHWDEQSDEVYRFYMAVRRKFNK